MAQTLIFKKDSLHNVSAGTKKIKKDEISWTHLIKNEDKIIDIVIDELYKEDEYTEDFKEDLIEKQRPGLLNFSNFTFINISIPNKDILDMDSKKTGLLQLSLIITKNKVFSIASEQSQVIAEIIESMKSVKLEEISTSCIISYILEDMIEYGIDIVESLKQKIDNLQKQIIEKRHTKDMMAIYELLETRKETLFYTSKALRADIELLKEINANKGKFIKALQFTSHVEDRFLYCWDLVETQKDSLAGTYDIYLAAQSNQMNRQIYKLSWLGSFLLIPTIISSLFGMNVDLPVQNFWIILIITIVVSTGFAFWIKRD